MGVKGVSVATLSRIEQGQDLTLTNARNIATLFGMTIEEMWPKRLDES